MEKVAFLQHISLLEEIALVGPMPFSDDIAKDTPILYIDGGLNHKRDANHIHFSVGDGDSCSDPELIQDKLAQTKDFTDLEYALSLIPENIKIVSLYGLLGGRVDHLMANFGAIHHFLNKRDYTLVLIEKSLMAHSAGQFSFEHQGTFSVISVIQQEIMITGDCDYPLEEKSPLRALSGLGISNIAHGTVNIICERPIFIYTLFD